MVAEASRSGTARNDNGSRLGGARADFVASLGRKVADLRSSLNRVKQTGEAATREEFERKLRALGSGAKILKFDAMDRAIGDALSVVERAQDALAKADVELLEQTLDDLPALAWSNERPGGARASGIERTAAPTYSAMIVGPALLAEALLEPCEGGPTFACESTPDAQAAFELACVTEPDLLVVDADVEDAFELVDAFMDDRRTESLPIVVVGSFLEPSEEARYVAIGVAKTIAKPTSREVLRNACIDALEPPRPVVVSKITGEPTLAELGERIAEEFRSAIVEGAASQSRGERIPLGEGTEVASAVWSAIARVREIVMARTGGAVRFAGKGPEGAIPLALVGEDEVARADRARAHARGTASEVRLQGRRIVVADDDPAVVWFMADLLRTSGCVVHEAFDGKQALELAYRTSPDVVVSDILMPELDGFSVCRALRRDVALRDVPVILLSWKEDLLQRVRELGAGAAGYVRKESDANAILARVRESLRPRARLEARLREEGRIRGRLDDMSVRTVLELACAMRPDARISVRDASFLFEIEIRNGAPVRATRAAGDGRFERGKDVLAELLGVRGGSFVVAPSTDLVEVDLDGNLAAQLAAPIAHARAATSLLLDSNEASRSLRVIFDEGRLDDYLRAMPDLPRTLTRRLREGVGPRTLMLDGADPTLVADLVCDLVGRGLVRRVEDAAGVDRLTAEKSRLLEQGDDRARFAPRTRTPAPEVAKSEPAAVEPRRDDASDADEEASCAIDPAPFCESPAPSCAVAEALADVPASGEIETTGEATTGETTLVDDTVYGEASASLHQESAPFREVEALSVEDASDAPDVEAGARDDDDDHVEDDRDDDDHVDGEDSLDDPAASRDAEALLAGDGETSASDESSDDLRDADEPTSTPIEASKADEGAEVPVSIRGLTTKSDSRWLVTFVVTIFAIAWAAMHFAHVEL